MTSESESTPSSEVAKEDVIVNVPNALSFARLVGAVAVGVLIELQFTMAAAVLFLLAATTDFLDGWWARKFDQVTKLGRVLDPFVDKIIITAALVALVGAQGSQVFGWMVTIIIGRELLVTSIRAMIEGKGGDFSARWLGKVKMVVQCAAIVASLLLLSEVKITALLHITRVLMALAVLITVASGVDYVIQAVRLSRSEPEQTTAQDG